MNTAQEIHTGILPNAIRLPVSGVLCAHPRRTRLIAEEYLENAQLVTDYRGMQVFIGNYGGRSLFAANCGIGAPAAAILIEELALKGAKNIVRLGTNDTMSEGGCLQLLKSTTVSEGLARGYGFDSPELFPSELLNDCIESQSKLAAGIRFEKVDAYHLDAYYAFLDPKRFASDQQRVVNDINDKNTSGRYTRDMESSALFMLADLRGLNVASVLQSIKKHGVKKEYEDSKEDLEVESLAIPMVLRALIKFEDLSKT